MGIYKVGDVVKLRDDLEVNKFYGKTKLNEAMVNAIGKKAEIKEIVKYKNKDEYYAKFASRYGGNWFISDEMIEGLWEECNSVNSSVKKYKLIDILNKIANGELKEGTKVNLIADDYLIKLYYDGKLIRFVASDNIYAFTPKDINNEDEYELIEPDHFADIGKMVEPTDNTKIEELDPDNYNLDNLSLIVTDTFKKLNEVIRKLNKEQ